MELIGGRQHPDARNNFCEEPMCCGGRAEDSGVQGVPADKQPDVFSQHGRLDDSVRDGQGDVGLEHTDGRCNGRADAGSALLL